MFCKLGEQFSNEIELIVRPKAFLAIKEHLENGDKVIVISASIYEWVFPWCNKNGIESALCTTIEVNNNGCLTGKLLSENCYGSEKVKRLLELESDRSSYYLYAYGDSRGDKELIEFADKGWYNKFK